jgi:hypothetical protein
MELIVVNVADVFEDQPENWTGPHVTDSMVVAAEQALGVRLPADYVDLVRHRNGGALRRNCYRTAFTTSWARDHFSLIVVLGIGGDSGIDVAGRGSSYLIGEWGYPNIGVVFGVTEMAGPDTVMFDYRECGPTGEPAVSYIGEDRVPHKVADNFGHFLNGLVPCEEMDQSDAG